ncbi:hypothetical protein [Peribacillus sp. SCS-155]|uniref:hypothetical protein n=1 Tax=Peribacillus sedimenti TaxID=3115297 RepID=UPI003905C322
MKKVAENNEDKKPAVIIRTVHANGITQLGTFTFFDALQQWSNSKQIKYELYKLQQDICVTFHSVGHPDYSRLQITAHQKKITINKKQHTEEAINEAGTIYQTSRQESLYDIVQRIGIKAENKIVFLTYIPKGKGAKRNKKDRLKASVLSGALAGDSSYG